MADLHITLKADPPKNGKVKFNEQAGILLLPEAGKFLASINEFENENAAIEKKRQAIRADNQNIKQQLQHEPNTATGKYNAKAYNKMLDENNDKMGEVVKEATKLQSDYSDVRWVWQLANSDTHLYKDSDNSTLSEGQKIQQLSFPKLLEGGGKAWIEAYHYKTDTPTFKIGNGFFVAATGTPDILSVEWRDGANKLISEADRKKIAYGSTVYLHIYTEALYGQDIEINLIDHFRLPGQQDIALPLNEMDHGIAKPTQGKPTQNKTFIRKVDVAAIPGETVAGVTGVLGTTVKGQKVTEGYVQKVKLAVYIDPFWHDLDSGDLRIYCSVKHASAKKPKVFDGDFVIVDKKQPMFFDTNTSGNSPVLVSDGKTSNRDDANRIDYTFGVFIDGTMNNMYNTAARLHWEADKIAQAHLNNDNPIDHLNVYAEGGHDVEKTEQRYEQGKTSYENELSNPAILFKYYNTDNFNAKHPVIKVYSEGMGTDTMAAKGEKPDKDDLLIVGDYKSDASMSGGAFGVDNELISDSKSGILSRVRRAIQLMVDNIDANPDNGDFIGTITVDVFGFSRGAAAARNFVSNICYPSYEVSFDGQLLYDRFGYKITSENYNREKPVLPANGHLGYLLTEKKLTFDRLTVRFAGLYDTVPHHGLTQKNNMNELGLNDIVKADYTVHLVAGDEHRANFSLVDISCITGKKGGGETEKGVELYLPGVHCDVGGSYTEGRPETNYVLMHSFLTNMEKDWQWMIDQGWYKEEELTDWAGLVYGGSRPYVSNQYSFIPLHLMLEYAARKDLDFDEKGILKKYAFTQYSGEVVKSHWWGTSGQIISQVPGNIAFLKKIKERIWDYAFGNEGRYVLEKLPRAEYADDSYWPSAEEKAARKLVDHANKGVEKQEEWINANIKKLRNKYLHFNANYDGVVINNPNLNGHKRERHIRGAVE